MPIVVLFTPFRWSDSLGVTFTIFLLLWFSFLFLGIWLSRAPRTEVRRRSLRLAISALAIWAIQAFAMWQIDNIVRDLSPDTVQSVLSAPSTKVVELAVVISWLVAFVVAIITSVKSRRAARRYAVPVADAFS